MVQGLQQAVVFATLAMALVLFINGRWRYDVVALLAMLAVTITGIVPAGSAFAGFGHPAVVTVAAVLVVSRGLSNSGVVDLLARPLYRVPNNTTLQIIALGSLVAVLSAFMNNVGALALLMPIAIKMAQKQNRSPSALLMPLAFGSLLGGLITLIGTPPNIIIATFRADAVGEPFRMFDFAPVGAGVAAAGLAYIALAGWRLVPHRKAAGSRDGLFEIGDYITEVTVPEGAKLAGKRVRDIAQLTDAEVVVLAIVRNGERMSYPVSISRILAGDVLVVEASSDDLKELVDEAGLKLSASRKLGPEALGAGGELGLIEAVVMTDSPLLRETPRSINLRSRYGVNLLGVARSGERKGGRLRSIRFQAGDVLLLQAPAISAAETLAAMGCLPLAGRDLRLGRPRHVAAAIAIFGTALLLAAVGLLEIQVAFTAAAVVMVMARLLDLREAYESIDWSIIVLLGAMIPVGEALELSGGANSVANAALWLAGSMPPAASLVLVMVATMFLSDLVNNAAAAVLMAPISIAIAQGFDASVDPFLMAVAIGASCAFLTPIGHQSNTLVMGPGGYHFGDYWRMGLLLEAIIVLVATPLILIFWPF